MEHDAKYLLQQAIDSTRSTRWQIISQTHTIMELQQADIQNRAEIEQLERTDDANKKETNSLWYANKTIQNS